MITNRRKVRVEWAHCDPAKIVFYPQYLIWFDSSTAWLFESVGLPTTVLFEQHKLAGMPLVDVKVRFLVPSRWGDDVTIESGVSDWRRSSFVVRHQLFKADGALGVECFETRVWAVPHPDDSARIKAAAIPPAVIARLSDDGTVAV